MIYIHDSFFNYDFTFKEDTNLTNNLSFITEKSKFYKEHPKGVEWVILKKNINKDLYVIPNSFFLRDVKDNQLYQL